MTSIPPICRMSPDVQRRPSERDINAFETATTLDVATQSVLFPPCGKPSSIDSTCLAIIGGLDRRILRAKSLWHGRTRSARANTHVSNTIVFGNSHLFQRSVWVSVSKMGVELKQRVRITAATRTDCRQNLCQASDEELCGVSSLQTVHLFLATGTRAISADVSFTTTFPGRGGRSLQHSCRLLSCRLCAVCHLACCRVRHHLL